MNEVTHITNLLHHCAHTEFIITDYGSIDCGSFASTQSIYPKPQNHLSENPIEQPRISSVSKEVSALNYNVTTNRSYSPSTVYFTNATDHTERNQSEFKGKKRKIPHLSNPMKSSSKQASERRIINEYWNLNSRKVVQEQFERDERIRVQQEREELARIERAQKQHLYNGALIEVYNQEQSTEFELVLETDPKTNNIVIEVAMLLIIHMKPHQIHGVKFLWNQVFESTAQIAASIEPHTQIDRGGSGALLAHCMGLGKTFTTIVLLHTLFQYSKLTHIHRVLILCPLNTAVNWKNEFDYWLSDLMSKIDVYLFNNDDIRTDAREEYLRRWHENGGVLLMGFEMYRRLTYTIDDNPYDCKDVSLLNRRNQSESEHISIKRYRKYLRDPGPDLIICDEGHIIKNLKSAINCTLNQIRTHRRIVLTGTPMQNNLNEYFAMVHFCKPNFLGTHQEFSDQFRILIEAGQHRDSSPSDVACMRRRIYALNRRLKTVIHREGFDVLRSFLPAKFEYAIKIRCRPLQRILYETYIQNQSINTMTEKLNMTKLFGDYQYLMKIWTHPWLLQPYFIQYYKKMLKENNQIEIENIFEDEFNDGNSKTRERSTTFNLLSPTTKCKTNVINGEDWMDAMKRQWWYSVFNPEDSQFDFELSGKFTIFKAILNECDSIGDKLLVFSRSLIALDYLEQCLAYWSEQSSLSKWEKSVDYFRIDGKVPIKQRAADMKLFNDVHNIRGRLFLISTLAGGLGINLFSANRVIILDTSWNPANDLQAMFRSYRLGQTKPVYIYRLIVKGTMEEKIYKRQITKQAMFHRVVDAKQLARHFTYDELAQLYQFDFDAENDPMDNDDTDQVQDQILRHLITTYPDTIVSYREHDSFLIHHDEENLTAEEQIQAKDEDENLSTQFKRPQN